MRLFHIKFCYWNFDVMCYKTCVCIEVSRTLSNINIWQIGNVIIPNSYHRHKGCAWFVPDLLRWRVPSCDVWIFPVVNNITSVLQYFPSNYLFSSYWRNNILLFCSPPVHTGEVVCGAELTVLHVHPVLLLGLRLMRKLLIPLLHVILSKDVHPRLSALIQQWDFNQRDSWYYQQRHHCYIQGNQNGQG